jgi:hypothetical protein
MTGRNWFWQFLGSRLAPRRPESTNVRKLDYEDWAGVQQVSRWGNTRRFRRFVVLLWIGMLAFDPWMVFRLEQGISVLARLPDLLLPTLSQLLITWVAFHGMRIGLAQPTLEDSAAMQFGVGFNALSSKEREELFQRRFRDVILGRVRKDEREAELRLRAEGAAYRLLRPGMVIVVAAYWAVCLLGPFEPIRGALIVTAIAFTWFAVAVLVMPTMVRMWTQPNEVGEVQIVGRQDEG